MVHRLFSRMRCGVARIVTALVLAGIASGVQAQAWPSKPVRILVPYPTGGPIDVFVRGITDRLAQTWGQTILIDNRPGGSTIPAAEVVARSPADGYTLLFTTDATFTINPHLFLKLPYDAQKDFDPVTLVAYLHMMMVAKPDLPANNINELVALAKARPGKLNYGSFGSGSQPHLATEQLKSKAGLNILHVPYKALPDAMFAVLKDEVQLTFIGPGTAISQVKGGKLKALAIAGQKRHPLFPDLPTFAESGYPEIDADVWYGIFAPAGTPREIVTKIHRDVLRWVNDPELREKHFIGRGYTPAGFAPDEFAAYIRRELASRAQTVKISGAKAE